MRSHSQDFYALDTVSSAEKVGGLSLTKRIWKKSVTRDANCNMRFMIRRQKEYIGATRADYRQTRPNPHRQERRSAHRRARAGPPRARSASGWSTAMSTTASVSRKTSCLICRSSTRSICSIKACTCPAVATPIRPTGARGPISKIPELKDREFNYTLEFTQKELLDRWNIDFALLTGPPTFYSVRRLARSRLGGGVVYGIQRLYDRALAGQETRASSMPSCSRPMTRRKRSRRFIAWRRARTLWRS